MSGKTECCPDCREKVSPQINGATDICTNADCACHRPLGVRVNDTSKVSAKFG